MKKILPVVLLLILLFSCGKKGHHLEKKYDKDGNLEMELEYLDGKPHGFGKVYYPNGRIHKTAQFKNGKRNGRFVTFFKNGKVDIEQNFKEDSLDGPMIMYYETGQKMGEDFYKNGRIVSGGSFNRNGDSISVHRGNVIRTYGGGKIYVLDCLANTHNNKVTGTIRFSDNGEIL